MSRKSIERSEKRTIQDNVVRGRLGEDIVRAAYEMGGYKTTRTGRGHDFRATKTDPLTGKSKSKYVEVKSGNARLSTLQKKTKRRYGGKYVVECI